MGNSIKKFKNHDTNQIAGKIVDEVLKDCAVNRSQDNITCIVFSFKDFVSEYSKLNSQQKENLVEEKPIYIHKEMNDHDGLELDKNCKIMKVASNNPFLTEVRETESNGSDNKSPKIEDDINIDSYKDIRLEEDKSDIITLKANKTAKKRNSIKFSRIRNKFKDSKAKDSSMQITLKRESGAFSPDISRDASLMSPNPISPRLMNFREIPSGLSRISRLDKTKKVKRKLKLQLKNKKNTSSPFS